MILGKIWVQIINNTKILTKFRFTKSGNPHKYKRESPGRGAAGTFKGEYK
ncbi:MAG: hypothetical protein ACLRVO_04790 [Blautia wexlerae]